METEYRRKNYPKLFLVWQAMRNRCYNPKSDSYLRYGGRGIQVCDEWKSSSLCFIKWAVEHGYKTGLQLDRKDNDGDYSPSNCQWITPKENSRNRRNTKYITYNGERKTVAELLENSNIESGTVYRWLRTKGEAFTVDKLKERGIIT